MVSKEAMKEYHLTLATRSPAETLTHYRSLVRRLHRRRSEVRCLGEAASGRVLEAITFTLYLRELRAYERRVQAVRTVVRMLFSQGYFSPQSRGGRRKVISLLAYKREKQLRRP